MDFYEINEAFASQAVMSIQHLHLPYEKVNPVGGAIALGHPLGCTGARQVATALSEAKREKKKVFVTSMCIGSGMVSLLSFLFPSVPSFTLFLSFDPSLILPLFCSSLGQSDVPGGEMLISRVWRLFSSMSSKLSAIQSRPCYVVSDIGCWMLDLGSEKQACRVNAS